LSYVLSFSDAPYGTRLPSVHQLAAELGVAPMTVNQVYQQLRDEGLVEMRPGLGAFTMRDPRKAPDDSQPINALSRDIDGIIAKAEALGVPAMSLVAMINARAHMRRPNTGLRLVFVCIFEGPGRDYIDDIRPHLSPLDTIELVTLDSLQADGPERRLCLQADLVITFGQREPEVRNTVKGAPVLGLRFLPSQRTRQTLAGLDPRARVAAVTHFQEYIAIMRPSVREFAPHVSDVRVTWSSAPDLSETLSMCEAVVFASGADHVAQLVRPGVPCFEFRHAPDPSALETILVPRLGQLRQAKAGLGSEKQTA